MAKEGATRKGAAKKLTPYNKFMKAELRKLKTESPNITHKEAFKRAAQNWSESSENPKNKEKAK